MIASDRELLREVLVHLKAYWSDLKKYEPEDEEQLEELWQLVEKIRDRLKAAR